MKKKMFIIIIIIIIILLIVTMLVVLCKSRIIKREIIEFQYNAEHYSEVLSNLTPSLVMGRTVFIEEFTTAKSIARGVEQIWIDVYGLDIVLQRPYSVAYDKQNNVWHVWGNSFCLNPLMLGGEVHAIISGETGEIIYIWHTS